MEARLSLTEAEAAVAEQRRLVPTESGQRRPELAKALLALSRAYEREDRAADALAAARESVVTLSPEFLQAPGPYSELMRGLVAQYIGLAQRSGARPDEALLSPIAQALGDLTRAEDDDDG